jgi:hypothetical protein
MQLSPPRATRAPGVHGAWQTTASALNRPVACLRRLLAALHVSTKFVKRGQ